MGGDGGSHDAAEQPSVGVDVPSDGCPSRITENLAAVAPVRLCRSMDSCRDPSGLRAMDAAVSVVRQRVDNITSFGVRRCALNLSGPLPVFFIEIPVPGSMPFSAGLYLKSLAGQTTSMGSLATGHAAWVVLCGLLLVSHGGAGALGTFQYLVDAGRRDSHGHGKKHETRSGIGQCPWWCVDPQRLLGRKPSPSSTFNLAAVFRQA